LDAGDAAPGSLASNLKLCARRRPEVAIKLSFGGGIGV